MGGNIGRGVLDLDPPADGMVVVLELSSYQTDLARALQPGHRGVPQPLARPSRPARRAGAAISRPSGGCSPRAGPTRAVIGVDEVEGRFLANQMREAAVGRPGDPGVGDAQAGGLRLDRSCRARGSSRSGGAGGRSASIDLRGIREPAGGAQPPERLRGLCAWRAASGWRRDAIEAAIAGFPGLPHRSQLVGERRGVRIVND